MNKELLAYMAGFTDADGSIGIVSVASTKQFVAQLAVYNCHPGPIELFEEYFGGKRRYRERENPRWRPIYEWKLTATKAANAITMLLPYLRVKDEQARIILQLQEIKGRNNAAFLRWHPDVKASQIEEMAKLKEACGLLNKRGISI